MFDSIRHLIAPASQTRKTSGFNLPQETMLHIFGFLEPSDLCCLSVVCRDWNLLASDRSLWRRFLPEVKEDVEAKDLYIRIMRSEMQESKNGLPAWMEDPDSEPSLEGVRKVLVLGSHGTGKTSFARACMKRDFLSSHKPTSGVDFNLLATQRGNIQLWDLAGPERFAQIERVYYKESDMALLTYDLFLPDPSVDGMLRMVIGLKADMVDLDSRAEKERWEEVKRRCLAVGPVRAGFHRVSSKTGEGVEDAVERMTRLLYTPQVEGYQGMVHLPDLQAWERMRMGIRRTRPAHPKNNNDSDNNDNPTCSIQ